MPSLAVEFTLEDFRKQFQHLRKAELMSELGASMLGSVDPRPEASGQCVKRILGILDAMTLEERAHPDILNLSRCRRIADGAGLPLHDIKQFLKQFRQIRVLMKKMAQMSL